MGFDRDKLTLHIGDKPVVENYAFVEDSCAFQFRDVSIPKKAGISTFMIVFDAFL